MSRPTFINSTVVYHDHSTEYNIDAKGQDISSVLRACQAEDVTPVEEEKGTTGMLFPRITKAAYEEGKAQSVDDELRSASVSAPKLVKTLNINEALGYLDTKNMSTRDLYKQLNDCYHLSFGEDNFRKYRAK